MNEIEKRELFEQQQKIFEARAQRMAKRSGSFNFLTWAVLHCPADCVRRVSRRHIQIRGCRGAGRESRSGQARRRRRRTTIRRRVIPRKRAAQRMRRPKRPPPRRRRVRPSSIRPGFCRSRMMMHSSRAPPAAKLSSPRGGGGGGDDAESRHHNAPTSIEDSSVNLLSADSHLGSTQMQGGSTLESVQSNMLGDFFSPWMIGSAHLPGTVGSLSIDMVAGTIAPVEAAAQPVLDDGERHRGHADQRRGRHGCAGRGGGAAGAHNGDRHRRAR